MKRVLIFVAVLLISSVPLGAKGGAAPTRPVANEGPMVSPLAQATSEGPVKQLTLAPFSEVVGKGGDTCNDFNPDPISCDTSQQGFLQASDCLLDDDTVLDFWIFNGTAGDQVTIDMESDEFDTYLFLLDTTPVTVTGVNDGGSGTNAQIVWTLDQTGTWAIGANNFAALPGDPGNYTLSLKCEDGVVIPPDAPSNLTATVVSSTEIDLFWQDNSNNEVDFEIDFAVGNGAFQNLGAVSANAAGASVSQLASDTDYTFRVRARNSAGNSDWSNEVSATTTGTSACVPSSTTVCLNNGRFQVRIDWRDFEGVNGVGTVVPVNSDDSGLYYFFTSDNWEMLLKVLDGCQINDHFWVFGAATTNVEYTLTVTDVQTGLVKQYSNPLGSPSVAITDTSAFATCP